MTVQELIDAGFVVDDSMSGRGDMNIDNQPKIPGESYTSKFYYLFVPDEYGYYKYANIVFHVYNKSVNAVEFKDSKVYAYRYDPSYALSGASVLINDIDFTDMNKEEAISAFEELVIKFDSDEKEEFMNNERHIIFGESGDYSYIIETDYDGETITNIEVNLDI